MIVPHSAQGKSCRTGFGIRLKLKKHWREQNFLDLYGLAGQIVEQCGHIFSIHTGGFPIRFDLPFDKIALLSMIFFYNS